mgnify:CR=1 FL=1
MPNRIAPRDRARYDLQLELTDLSGGFVSQAATYSLDERFLEDVQNMELVQGMWQQRKGYHLSGSFAGVGSQAYTARGLHVFYKQGSLHILGAFGQDLYDTYQATSDGKGKLVASDITGSNPVRFADFKEDCFFVNGRDSLRRYDGNSVTNVAAPVGSLLAVYDNRLVMAGIRGDALTLYYSEDGDGTVWPALNYLTVDGLSNEQITALFPLQGKLYIFTNKAIYSLIGSLDNFTVSKEVEGIGAVSAEAVQMFGNRFYFISEEGDIYEFDGGSFPTQISRYIRRFIQSELTYSHWRRACTTYYRDGVWFTFDNTSIPEKRITLVYYPDYGAWTKFVGIPAAAYVYIEDSLFFTGVHNTGSLYQYGTQYTDETRAVSSYLKPVKWSFDALENRKRFKVLYLRGAVQGGGGNGFIIDFYVDDALVATVHSAADVASGTEIWGQKNWGEMYWGFASSTAGTAWGKAKWNEFEWAGAKVRYAPKWGSAVWGDFNWGDKREGDLVEDVGLVYRKIYLSQYNVISGKTLQIVLRNEQPNHGFRFEYLRLEYVQKGAR